MGVAACFSMVYFSMTTGLSAWPVAMATVFDCFGCCEADTVMGAVYLVEAVVGVVPLMV